jgi:hypothetical protein
MTPRPFILAAALAAGVAVTACEPKPALPPLVQEGPCNTTYTWANRGTRCVIFTSTRKPGFWLKDQAIYAYFEVSHGTGKIVKDPA